MIRLAPATHAFVLLQAVFLVQAVSAATMDEFLFGDLKALQPSVSPESVSAASRWFNEPEIRVTPERSVLNENTRTYSLRFRPTSARETRARTRLERIDIQLDVEDMTRPLTDILRSRYRTLLDLAELEADVVLLAREAHLAQSILNAEETLYSTDTVSTSRLQRSITESQAASNALTQAQTVLARMRADTVGDALQLAPDSPRAELPLISPSEIAGTVRNLLPLQDVAGDSHPIDNGPGVIEARLEVDRARERVELERSQNAFHINLLELGLEDRVANRYNFTLGFQLPQRRSSGLRRRQAQLQVAEQRAALVRTLVREDLLLRANRINWQVTAWHAAARTHDSQVGGSTTDDALLAAAAEQTRLATLRTMARTHLALLRDYINLLDEMGLLHSQPWQNQLLGK